MMARMSCILTIVATVVVLVAGDCMKNITLLPILASYDPQYNGGYRRIDRPENDRIVKKIVAKSVKFINSGADKGIHFTDDYHYVAYREVVKTVLNYCCQFQMDECERSDEASNCQYKNKHVCSVEARQTLYSLNVTIDTKSLRCVGLNKPK